MSKKYMSRPPYCNGYIPEYTIPPMTVEEYKNYEEEFFGFLDNKPLPEPVEEEAGIFKRVLKFTGISKTPKYEDKYKHIVLEMNKINQAHLDGGSGDDFDNLIKSSSKTSPPNLPRTEDKATQTRTEDKATQTEDEVVTCDLEVQTVRPKRRFLKSLRRFFRRSLKCLKTEE